MGVLQTIHGIWSESRLMSIDPLVDTKARSILDARKADIEQAALLLRYRINEAVRDIMIEIDCLDPKTGEFMNHPDELITKNKSKRSNYTTIHFYPVGQCLMMAKLTEYAVQPFMDPEKIFSKEKDFVTKHAFARLYERHIDQFGRELSRLLKDLRPLWIIPRRVHGIMDNSYLHNLMQIGPYLLDVGSDTVENTPLEIRFDTPELMDFSDISSYYVHAKVIEKYWGVRIYKNTLFPNIAPMYPYIQVDDWGKIRLCDVNFRFFDLYHGMSSAESFVLWEESGDFPDFPLEYRKEILEKIRPEWHSAPIVVIDREKVVDIWTDAFVTWKKIHSDAQLGDEKNLQFLITGAMEAAKRVKNIRVQELSKRNIHSSNP